VVLAGEALAEGAPGPGREVLAALAARAGEEDPFLLLFTSGTTGRPKGVRLAQRAIVHAIDAGALATGVGEADLGLHFLPFGHVAGHDHFALALACERKLHPVLRANDTLAEVRAGGDATGFDGWIWTGDLPAVLETEATPPAWPLEVDTEARSAARERLAALGPPPYLALTWRAGTDTARGREFGAERISLTKSVPPKALGAAVRGWRGTALLLQRGARPEDAADFAAGFAAPFHDLSALGEDLRALLATLSLVDEYVSVSNTNIHLLAGTGGRARVLVPFPPEWRWMRREDRSPWFPDFPVYRQPVARDWSAPLAALRKDLGL